MQNTRTLRAAAILVATLGATLAAGTSTVGAGAEAMQPNRLLDTRAGLGAPAGWLDPGETIELAVNAPGATSVGLNLTAAEAIAPGFVTAWPCGETPPATSILNFVPGRITANFIAVGLSGGRVCLAASASVHLVADLMGGFNGNDFQGARPDRLLDTRESGDPLSDGEVRPLKVTGGPGISAAAGAVALNVTVVSPSADGYVTAYPCGPRPEASTVNFRAGEIVPSFTLVPAPGGEVCFFASTGTHLVVDAFGWSAKADALRLGAPERLLDTRTGLGWPAGAAGPGGAVELRVAGRAGVPDDAAAALVTVTATGGSANGFVTVWPCDHPRPTASVLNLRPGYLGSNLAFVPLAEAEGTVCLYAWTTDGSSVHLVADSVGAVPGGPDRDPPPPDPEPDPDPPSDSYFPTLPVGAALPGDAECAARVRSAPEIRAANVSYNATPGSGPPTNPPWPMYARVTGNFTGTTDEIIQWAACKWGFDEDLVRAQTAKESWWMQKAVGDNGESFGVMQVREPYWGWAFPDSAISTAYNMDAALAARRNCFEGNETWLGGGYGPGDLWGCVGLWFSGRWHDPPAAQYIVEVQDYLNSRIWETPEFINFQG